MKHSEKKISKIIEELTVFAGKVEAQDINIHLSHDEQKIYIKFDFDFNPESIEKIQRLERLLNPINKNEGFDGMYWELVGESSAGLNVQLSLIGQMIDHADVVVEGNVLHLLLTKTKIIK